MSRQMKLQLNAPKFMELLGRIVKSKDEDKSRTLQQWVHAIAKDPKDEERLLAAFVTMKECTERNKDVLKVQKVTVWRPHKDKPEELQIEFAR